MAKDNGQEIPDLLGRLAELRHEAEGLIARQATLYRQVAEGSSDEQVEQAARRLIANPKTAVLQQDPQTELRSIGEQLTTNRRAQGILSKTLGLLELREGRAAAKPAFDNAISFVPKLAAALATLQAIQLQATSALREFDRIDGAVAGLAVQHPDEKPVYSEWQLAPLRTWHTTLVGDGFNKSKVDYWREECGELGLKID